MNDELVVPRAGMDAQQFTEISQNLVDPDSQVVVGVLSQEAQVSTRNLNTISDLTGDALQPILDQIEILAVDAALVAHALIDDLKQPGDDGQRTINVVNDAGVNLAAGADDLFLHFQLLQFIL